MHNLKPHTLYRTVNVKIAYEASLSDEKVADAVNEILNNALQNAVGGNSIVADWSMRFDPPKQAKETSDQPKDGDLFAFIGAKKVHVTNFDQKQYRALVIYDGRVSDKYYGRTKEFCVKRAFEMVKKADPKHPVKEIRIFYRPKRKTEYGWGEGWELMNTIKPDEPRGPNHTVDTGKVGTV